MVTIAPLYRAPEHVLPDNAPLVEIHDSPRVDIRNVARVKILDTPRIGIHDNTFLRDLAHELRSPLCSFNLALTSLDNDTALDADDRALLLGALRGSAAHMQSIVDNLSDAAESGALSFAVRPTETDLAAIVRDAIDIVAPLLRPSGQRVVVDLPCDPLTVLADPPRLRQVLVNLLHNAIKYGPCGETITVRARVEAMATVEVIDRGPTIPLDQRARLFERLFRGHATNTPGEGLGLAISRAIVAAHGGSIGLRCAAGHGNTFWFTLHLG